jgi:RNA polymerase sigma-70 factor (ECF subfamily)
MTSTPISRIKGPADDAVFKVAVCWAVAIAPRLNYRLWRFCLLTRMPVPAMSDQTDDQLMLDYAAGDVKAFNLLYERQRGPLYRFILRQVNDDVTANDLYQGCWEKIIKARSQYRKGVPFRAWMFRLARNHVIDHFRRSKPGSDEGVAEQIEPAPGPEDRLSEQQQTQTLADAITQLAPEQRETLLLKLESDLDLATIADITGVKPETAKSRLRYATARLRELLNPTASLGESSHG